MQFKCCGSNNYTDWADSQWIKSPEASGRKVPDSCCKTITDLCGRRDHPSNIYKEVKSKRASELLSLYKGGGQGVRVLGYCCKLSVCFKVSRIPYKTEFISLVQHSAI